MKISTLKKVLVLGSSGFTGQAVLRQLRKMEGVKVTGFSSSDCDLTNHRLTMEKVEPLADGASVIFLSSVGRIKDDSRKSMAKNIDMAHNVREALEKSGNARSLIFSSSSDVYGTPPASLPITEDTARQPTSCYGISKLTSESILMDLPGLNYPVSTLRLPGVYGVGDGFRSVAGKFIQLVSNGKKIMISGDGTMQRDYVRVDDVCNLVAALLLRPFHGVLNVATGRSIAIKDIVELIGAKLGAKPNISYTGKKSARDYDLVFNHEKLTALYPEVEFQDIETGLEKYIESL